MKLYRWPKSRSFRAACMLEEASCYYKRIGVDVSSGATSDPAFRLINPMGKVPVHVDGDACVAESAAICAYVAGRVSQTGLAPALGYPARGRPVQWLLVQARPTWSARISIRHRAVQDRRSAAGVSRLPPLTRSPCHATPWRSTRRQHEREGRTWNDE